MINNDIGDHDQLNQCEDVIFKFIHQPCVMPISCEVELEVEVEFANPKFCLGHFEIVMHLC